MACTQNMQIVLWYYIYIGMSGLKLYYFKNALIYEFNYSIIRFCSPLADYTIIISIMSTIKQSFACNKLKQQKTIYKLNRLPFIDRTNLTWIVQYFWWIEDNVYHWKKEWLIMIVFLVVYVTSITLHDIL